MMTKMDRMTKPEDDGRLLLRDQKNSALWCVSFWSHPAWIDSGLHSLSTSATMQLAIYHRINAALHKETVAEIIGGVKFVIPNSRLAAYGDFRYDTDWEDMYCDLKHVNEEKQRGEVHSKISDRLQNENSFKSSCFASHTTLKVPDNNILTKYKEEKSQFCREKFISRWLNKVKSVLEDSRRIATDAQALDSRTEGLIKPCLRFIHIAEGNSSLLKIMDSDIPFMIDFNQLRREPVSKMELLSLPQPEFDGESKLDVKALDDLWLKLAAARVRRLWSPATQSVEEEAATHHQKYSLATVNFLRRSRQNYQPDCAVERLEIPRETEVELLGSLLHDIEETTEEPRPVYQDTEGVKRDYFVPSSVEWHNQNSSHFSLNTLSENPTTTVAQKVVFGISADKKQTHNFSSKTEHRAPPGFATLPFRFYKSTPPPSLGSYPNVPQSVVRQPYMYWKAMNGNVVIQNNYHMSQQIQENISTSKTNNSPSSFNPTTVRLSIRNYNCPQRPGAPMQLTSQCSKIHPRLNKADNKSEILRQQILNDRLHANQMDKMKENENAKHSNDSVFVTNKDPLLLTNEENRSPFATYQSEVNLTRYCSNYPPLIPDKCSKYKGAANIYVNDNEHKSLQQSVSSIKKLSMLPSSFETRTSLAVYQNELHTTRSCNFFIPTVSEKCGYQATKVCSKQLNCPIQKHESRIPYWTNNPGINYSLPPPGIHNVFSSRIKVPGITYHKTKFLAGVTVNNLRDVQEKFYCQKNTYSETEDALKSDKLGVTLPLLVEENSVCYEDKVTKWLETVNQNMESDSFLKSESSCQMSSNSDKLGNIRDGKSNSSYVYGHEDHSKHTKAFSHNTEDNVSLKQTRKDLKNRKMKGKNLLLMHFDMFDKSLKLKKGHDLEGKIKLVKRYFSEIGLKRKNSKTFLTQNAKNVKTRNLFKRTRDKQVMSEEKNLSSSEMDFEPHHMLKHSSEKWKQFSKSIDEFKILYRENIHFNGFPSKRSKLKLFDEESWTYSELVWKISCINYFDALTNDLFFSKKSDLTKKDGYVAESGHRIDGWTHFKIVVKIILRNILKKLKNREAREKRVIK